MKCRFIISYNATVSYSFSYLIQLPLLLLVSSIRDVQKRTESVNTDEDPSGWRPYFTFIDTVGEKHLKNEGVQGTRLVLLIAGGLYVSA